jgi:hypothetical protein
VKAAPKITPAQALCLYNLATYCPTNDAAVKSCTRAKLLDAERGFTRKGARALLASTYGKAPRLPAWVATLANPTEQKHTGIFVANRDGTYHCADCIPSTVDLGDPDVEVWEERSDGWLRPVICCKCKLSIPVYVDGK